MVNKKLLGNILLEERDELVEKLKLAGIFKLSDIIPTVREEIAENMLKMVDTDAFFLPRIEHKKLYTVVGMTNSGKTWWSLGTAISLAREGMNVSYITTEDTIHDLVGYLHLMDARDELFERLTIRYVEDISSAELREMLQLMDESGTDIVVIDYIRADVLRTHSGDLNQTMREIFKVLRGQLEVLDLTIIATIQANASLYTKDLGSIVESNVNSLFTMIDGGFITSQRSHVLGLLVKSGPKRGVMVLKAKTPWNETIGQVFEYGQVRESDFRIRYKEGQTFANFNSANNLGSIPKRINKGRGGNL